MPISLSQNKFEQEAPISKTQKISPVAGAEARWTPPKSSGTKNFYRRDRRVRGGKIKK
jgi:hypothetical protein